MLIWVIDCGGAFSLFFEWLELDTALNFSILWLNVSQGKIIFLTQTLKMQARSLYQLVWGEHDSGAHKIDLLEQSWVLASLIVGVISVEIMVVDDVVVDQMSADKIVIDKMTSWQNGQSNKW